MINLQPIEPRAKSDGSTLSVHSIFRTLQGEGPFRGHRALFIRLAGCNLACAQCDTDYTNGRSELAIANIVKHANLRFPDWLIVITGGEPFRQNIQPLVLSLLAHGHTVQIETNGILPLPSPAFAGICSTDTNDKNACFVVVSPKTNKVHPSIAKVACAYKYTVKAYDLEADGIPGSALDNPTCGIIARPPSGIPVYLQPCDEKDAECNRLNTIEAVQAAMAHGHIFQMQLHKQVGLD